MDNKTLRQNILDELEFEPSIDAAHIGLAVDDGVVTLTGHVSSYEEKLAAERVVRRVKGVKAIVQEMQVRYHYQLKTDDDQIARRAAGVLAWSLVPSGAIQVTVEKGWVVLSGKVDWQYQRVAAEAAVSKLAGVSGVTNLIERTRKRSRRMSSTRSRRRCIATRRSWPKLSRSRSRTGRCGSMAK